MPLIFVGLQIHHESLPLLQFLFSFASELLPNPKVDLRVFGAFVDVFFYGSYGECHFHQLGGSNVF
jgi:hypothetical protein